METHFRPVKLGCLLRFLQIPWMVVQPLSRILRRFSARRIPLSCPGATRHLRAPVTSLILAILAVTSIPASQAEDSVSLQPRLRTTEHMLLNRSKVAIPGSQLTFGEEARMPDPPTAVLTVHKIGSGEAVKARLTWEVKDLREGILHQAAEEVGLDTAGPREFRCSLPSGKHVGPFLFHYQWVEGEKRLSGVIPLSQANTILQLEDFEKVAFPAKVFCRFDPSSAHSGRLGLRIEPAETVTTVPLITVLPGRPTGLSIWLNAEKPGGRLELNVSGVIQGNEAHHKWTVQGPEINWQGWKQVEFDLPVYADLNQPASPEALKKDPNAKGPANYPLRLESLVLHGTGPLSIDEIDVRTQEERPSQLHVASGGDKPAYLLFPGDTYRIRAQNSSLMFPLKGEFRAEVSDLARRNVASLVQTLDLPPGQAHEMEISTQGWLTGVYGVRLHATHEGVTLLRNFSEEPTAPDFLGQRFVLYRPDSPGLDSFTAPAFQQNAHRVESELGKRHEVVPVQWHNSYPEKRDGIEAREGMWMWHVYDPQIRDAVSSEKSIIARLGLTPAWASAEGRFDDMTGNRDWVGDPFTLPERSITWERYVYKVVKRYRKQVSMWEIWSKPDDPVFKTTAREFTDRILKVASRAARSAAPQCRLLLGGITKDNLLPFLRDLIQCGGHTLVDAIGVHPSVDPLSPERAFLGEMLEEACRIAEKAGVGDKLWITELGWNVGRPEDVSELEQAQYLARAIIIARFAGIRRILLDLHAPQWEVSGSGLLYRPPAQNFIHYRLGALVFKHLNRTLSEDTHPLCELYLRDRSLRLSRAYLFQNPQGYLLALWRESGTATLPRFGTEVKDMVGNLLPPEKSILEISGSPLFITLPPEELLELRRRIERQPLQFEDEPASQWKMKLHHFVDVGDPADEQKSGYTISGKNAVATLSSQYPDKRFLKDSGRILHESEVYSIPLATLVDQDLILQRRIDYDSKDQRCRVSVDGKEVGIWLVPGQDRVRRWRETHFIIPHVFLSGKTNATITLSAITGPFTTFDFAAGAKSPGTLFLSDWQPLMDTEGWIGLARADTSFLHTPISIQKRTYAKGLGVHAPSILIFNLNYAFKKFQFHCGIDDVTEGKGSVVFRVLGDQKPLYDSKRVNAFTKLEPQEIDVTGLQVLQLIVEDGGDGKESDVADWADARLSY